MWRARRTVVVGDPLQLEPVVVPPWTAQRALRDDHGVAEEWAPGRTSVQQLAGRTNRYGTLLPAELPDGSRDVWTGAPLRVHRRCDDPMFSVSNAIAYDRCTAPPTAAPTVTPRSAARCTWPPPRPTGTESPRRAGHCAASFSGCATTAASTSPGTCTSSARSVLSSPVRGRPVGTCAGRADRHVHTTQGKEADVVILVLGTDPRGPGARAWAASKPNLLNLAVSRAKRRLLVIGDREAWRDQRYFATLAESLPARTWRGERQRG